jgi:hypothetical protein
LQNWWDTHAGYQLAPHSSTWQPASVVHVPAFFTVDSVFHFVGVEAGFRQVAIANWNIGH